MKTVEITAAVTLVLSSGSTTTDLRELLDSRIRNAIRDRYPQHIVEALQVQVSG